MKYHSLTIRPNNIYVQESIENDTIIKSVSLTPVVSNTSIRSSLIALIDSDEVTLCNLLTNRIESKILNIPIKKGTRIELRTEGENEIDLLFLELEPYEVPEEREETEYKVVKIREGVNYSINETEKIKILNISISDEGREETKESRTLVIIKENDIILKITELEIGRKECEVVEIDLENRNVEVEVQGPNSIDLLLIESKEQSENACESSEQQENECENEKELESEGEKCCSEKEDNENQKEEHSLISSTINTQNSCEKCNEESCSCVQVNKKRRLPFAAEEEVKRTVAEKEKSAGVTVISEGIGKLIGKKSFISADYSVIAGGVDKSFSETVLVRRLPEHIHLKYFADIVKGSREGAVFKVEIAAEEGPTEILLNIGKIKSQ